MLYRDQIGENQNPPPYSFPGVQINSFRLKADLNSLQDLCDRVLNVGELEQRGFEFRPIFPFVDLEILRYPRMEYAYFPSGCFVSQNECYVRLFVMKYLDVGGLLMPDGEVAVFCPLLIVDNAWSAFSGRDVLGFQKLFGVFDPFPKTNPFATVSTEVFTTFDFDVKAKSMPVVTIKQAPGKRAKAARLPDKDKKWPWGHIDLNDIHPDHHALARSVDPTALFFESVSMKQFRDPVLPINACYQAILQSVIFVDEIGDFEPLPPARIMINDYASLKLAENLGIAPGTWLTPLSQYHLECSFFFGETIRIFENDHAWWEWWRWF